MKIKKVVTLAVAVGVAFAVQASSFKWTMSTSAYLWEDSSTKLSGATVYLINADTISQSDFLTSLRGSDNGKGAATRWTTMVGSDKVTGSSSVTTTTSGGFTSQTFTNTDKAAGEGGYLNAYMVAFVEDGEGNSQVLISATKSAAYDLSATKSLSFATTGKSAYGTSAFGSAGWYTVYTADTPEPTSGLLMLVGVGLLGLRRRRM